MLQKCIVLLFFGLLTYQIPFTQPLVADSFLLTRPANSAYRFYVHTIGNGLLLNNGAEYNANYSGIAGSPFFGQDGFSDGAICYNHITYYQTPLAYDLLTNQVVFKNFTNTKVVLKNTLIDSMYLSGHKFVFLGREKDNPSQVPADIYDIIFQGKLVVYVKRLRKIESSFKTEDPMHFKQYDFYVIEKSGRLYPVSTKNSLMSLFDEHASEMKKMWKLNHLDFKKYPEKAILESVDYYEALTK